MHEFQQVLYCCNYDIIFVTETWLHSEVSSGLFDPKSDYYVLRHDRADSHHGGGVAAFVGRHLTVCEVVLDSRYDSLELLCFDVFLSTKTVRFFVVYRSPNGVGSGGNGADVFENMRLLSGNKAAVLNAYYASVNVIDNGYMPVCHTPIFKHAIETVVFHARGVEAAINKLKPNLSSGPDNMPPLLFKKLKHSISKPLALLFNQLLSVGFVPESWKKAVIIPVYKHGPAEMPKNYRPISLTSVAGKLMERGIANALYEHFSCNGLLSSVQHGFVKGKSTCTNLLECVNDWTVILQDKSSVTVAYIDFSKAFDTVSHEKLFARMHAYGIRGSLLKWIQNFLTGRTHQTRVGCALSDIADLLSGIVQGSGLGPVFFLVFIDGLAKVLESIGVVTKFFADDVKVYLQIIKDDDCITLQKALDHISHWASDWQLQVSVGKCNILHIGSSHGSHQYHIGNDVIPHVSQCIDLGVVMTSSLSPTEHICEITMKAHRRANSILRCFVCRNNSLLLRAFMVYVRPILEYNCVIWSPSLVRDIEQLEKVQRRFTKRLCGMKSLTYSERLRQLGLPSLELRRLHLDLVFCYKIVFGLVSVKLDDFFEIRSDSRTRGHAYKLFKSRCTSIIRSNFFTERVINIWNCLPPTVNFTTLTSFRRTIQDVDFSRFMKCSAF